MKQLAIFVASLGLLSAPAMGNPIDPRESTYTCKVFDSSDDTSHPERVVRVGKHGAVTVPLADGAHAIRLTWHEWTLNLNLAPVGQVREILGAASHLHFKLRSHAPRVSVYCTNDALP